MELRRLVRHVYIIIIGKRAERNSAAENYASFSMLVFYVPIWMLSQAMYKTRKDETHTHERHFLQIPRKTKYYEIKCNL